MSTGVRDAYDAIALEYDRQLEDDAWMRRILWKQYLHAFRHGQHVLDVGCGTGTDAVFLAQHGIRVTGIDISPAMVARAESKVSRHGLSQEIRLRVMDSGDLSCLPANEFDGVISSFASLNTLSTLTQFAADAARLLRPNGRMILHLLNGASLWEWAGLMRHGSWGEARQLGKRRERTLAVGGHPVQHYLPRADEAYAHYFACHFRLRRTAALGITRPPYPIASMPHILLAALTRLDQSIGSHQPFINRGRFVLLDMVKDGRLADDERVEHNARRKP